MLARNCSGDKNFIIEKLRFVNYYRLAGYLYPFRKRRASDGFVEDDFEDGTTFAQVWTLYRFDRRMRFLIIDAVERIEIGLRTCIAYRWAESCVHKGISNPQGKSNYYRNSGTFKNLLKKVQEQYSASKERCALHYKGDAWNISKVEDLPVWVFVEFTTFANLKILCEKCLKPKIAQAVAFDFGFSDKEKFCAMLTLMREVRNTCAHHGMIWNKPWEKEKTKTPIAPDLPGMLPNTCRDDFKKRLAYVLCCCEFLLKTIVPDSAWKSRVKRLIEEIPLPDKMLTRMGITKDFKARF